METDLQIYVQRDGQQYGPYTRRVAKAMLKDGSLSPDDQAWHEGLSEWQSLDSILLPVKSAKPWWKRDVEDFSWWNPSSNGRLSHTVTVLGAVAGILLVGGYIYSRVSKGYSQPEKVDREAVTQVTNPSVRTPPVVAATRRSEDDRARDSAKLLVHNRLKAPSTARYVEARILKKEGRWYQIFVVVDAQNSFGASIRSHYVCTLELGENDKFEYHPYYGIQERDEESLELPRTLESLREVNGWPGTEAATK